MEVILKSDVDKLGFKDELVNVKAGYARNYLIPKGLAITAGKKERLMHDETLRQRAFKDEKIKADAQKIADALKSEVVKIGAKVGENGKIFGSVNTVQLVDALKKLGHEVDRKSITINNEPIKTIGIYDAEVKLHKDISVSVKFEVAEE